MLYLSFTFIISDFTFHFIFFIIFICYTIDKIRTDVYS